MSVSSLRPTATRLACTAFVLSLAGCSTFDSLFSSDKVDYRGAAARQTQGLEVPPDLSQLAKDNRAQVQGGSITASALSAVKPATPAGVQTSTTASGTVALNAAGDVRLERSGTDRWLHTSATPEQIWPQLRAFWQERGLELVKEQPEVGTMETNWAENRAKLPQDFVRSTIGKVFDGLYSTGERDMYRTRIERSASGTDIFISHRGMQEVYTTQARDSTAWQNRPSDPYLEAEMLSRLMLKLGGKEDAAKTVVAEAGKPAPATSVTKVGGEGQRVARRPLSEVPDSLTVADGFDRAWRRVGLSLDRHGFTIEDRDRAAGLFYLRYADPEQAGKEEPNFFQKLFGAKAPTPARYRVSVKADGDKSTVRILDDRSQAVTDDNAKRILSLLMDDLK
ncbi:outer membrane protein assembly factor BamC [Roseateles sp.]|jgi:outer membrane protein assembly factor BamC|uniref:outer membrane protein assembly factor BamC n=1 Tax=Roseateles sp. TaxID=1971397 RepID=UPI003BA985DC